MHRKRFYAGKDGGRKKRQQTTESSGKELLERLRERGTGAQEDEQLRDSARMLENHLKKEIEKRNAVDSEKSAGVLPKEELEDVEQPKKELEDVEQPKKELEDVELPKKELEDVRQPKEEPVHREQQLEDVSNVIESREEKLSRIDGEESSSPSSKRRRISDDDVVTIETATDGDVKMSPAVDIDGSAERVSDDIAAESSERELEAVVAASKTAAADGEEGELIAEEICNSPCDRPFMILGQYLPCYVYIEKFTLVIERLTNNLRMYSW